MVVCRIRILERHGVIYRAAKPQLYKSEALLYSDVPQFCDIGLWSTYRYSQLDWRNKGHRRWRWNYAAHLITSRRIHHSSLLTPNFSLSDIIYFC